MSSVVDFSLVLIVALLNMANNPGISLFHLSDLDALNINSQQPEELEAIEDEKQRHEEVCGNLIFYFLICNTSKNLSLGRILLIIRKIISSS